MFDRFRESKTGEPEVRQEQESDTQGQRAEPRRTVRFPESDMAGVIAGFMRDAFEDLEEHSHLAGRGDTQAMDRLEIITRAKVRFLAGILDQSNPKLARDLRQRVMELSQRLDGIEFFEEAVDLIGQAIAQSGLFGRKARGLSIDDGTGIKGLLSGGQLEP
jgi:hypothetical protein